MLNHFVNSDVKIIILFNQSKSKDVKIIRFTSSKERPISFFIS
jgi:hypothetical protein